MSKNDEQIKQVLTYIKTKTEALGTKPRGSWKTNGVFKFDGGETHKNINTINDVEVCVDILADLLQEKNCRDEAAKLLDVESTEVKWNDYSFDDWLHDIKLRTSMIKWDIEKKKLNALESKLKDLRSEDAKTADAISDIMAELG